MNKNIEIKSVVIHILDISLSLPIMSGSEAYLNENSKKYITELVKKSFYSDDAKSCRFNDGLTFWEKCNDDSWNLVSLSHNLAMEIFSIMRRNPEIRDSDIIVGYAEIADEDYIFMLKLDYKNAFTHHVSSQEEVNKVDIIEYRTILPATTAKVRECFFVGIENQVVKVIENKIEVDGIKDFYISKQILNCTQESTPRQKITKIVKVAHEVGELYYSVESELEHKIHNAIIEEMENSKRIQVEKLGQKVFGKNNEAQKKFFEELSNSEINKKDNFALSDEFTKKISKQAFKTSSGVEIKIPTQIYSNPDDIEFINNPDGTVSLLIKKILI